MNNYSNHVSSCFDEVKLSRELMREIHNWQDWDALHPKVLEAVKQLQQLYQQQIEEGIQ